MKKQISFLVQGSQTEPYKVKFYLDGNSLTASCTCQAGEMGTYCNHRLRILLGNPVDIVSDNLDDIEIVLEHLQQSSLNIPAQNFLTADAAHVKAKADLSARTKQLSAALLGRVYGQSSTF